MTQLYDTSNDPVVQDIPWTIMGVIKRIQVTQSGALLVEGARIENADAHAAQPASEKRNLSIRGICSES